LTDVAASTLTGLNELMRVRLAPLTCRAIVLVVNVPAAEHALEAKADETGAALNLFAAGVVLCKGAIVYAGVYAAGLSGATVAGGFTGDVLA
jgi:hypothetical protein